MSHQFFSREDKENTNDSQNTNTSDSSKPAAPSKEEEIRKAAETSRQPTEENDGVHRMAVRTGHQKLPDDPDEIAYADDQGEHAELAQSALQAGDLQRSIYHLA